MPRVKGPKRAGELQFEWACWLDSCSCSRRERESLAYGRDGARRGLLRGDGQSFAATTQPANKCSAKTKLGLPKEATLGGAHLPLLLPLLSGGLEQDDRRRDLRPQVAERDSSWGGFIVRCRSSSSRCQRAQASATTAAPATATRADTKTASTTRDAQDPEQ